MSRNRRVLDPRPAPRRRLGVAVLALTCAVSLVACSNDSSSSSTGSSSTANRRLSGVVPKPVPDVSKQSLPAATAAATPVQFVAKKGHLLLVYFGYTSCPDICPTTLADLRSALRLVGNRAVDVDVTFTTIDPRRDSAEVVTNYLHGFFPAGVALRTDDDAALRAVTTAFGATYKVDYQSMGDPQVLHSAYLYAVDDQGHVLVEWPFGSTSKDIAADLELLLDREGATT